MELRNTQPKARINSMAIAERSKCDVTKDKKCSKGNCERRGRLSVTFLFLQPLKLTALEINFILCFHHVKAAHSAESGVPSLIRQKLLHHILLAACLSVCPLARISSLLGALNREEELHNQIIAEGTFRMGIRTANICPLNRRFEFTYQSLFWLPHTPISHASLASGCSAERACQGTRRRRSRSMTHTANRKLNLNLGKTKEIE